MMPSLMDHIRQALGLRPPMPLTMTSEQAQVADRQRVVAERLGQRQRAIDLQIEVLRADTADSRQSHHP